jgi:methionyl-tRNA formyltransferase
MRIIFMGTPDFAVATLKALVENHMEVVAVVTAPDKPTGRGLKVSESPVKKYAVEQGIPVLQPERLKNRAFLEELAAYQADVQIVVAFRMLPEAVWNMPPKGTINLHGSLLPKYRGAAPINWAIINGEKTTGVTTFFIEKEIDTGKIIFRQEIPIGQNETAGELHDRMMDIGAELVVKTVHALEAGDYPQTEQVFTEDLPFAPKIFKETTAINWNLPAADLHNFIRGLSPYPGAWSTLQGKQVKLFQCTPLSTLPEGLDSIPDSSCIWYTDHKQQLIVSTADGFLQILSLQLEGKKRMQTEEFLRGYRFSI